MKKLNLLALPAVAAVMLFNVSSNAATVSGTSSATIVAPIAISQTTGISFGTLAPTGTAGTATLSTAGAVTATNVDILGGSPTAGAYTVTGSGSQGFTITLPSTDQTLSDGGSETMTLNNFVSSVGSSSALSSGTQSFTIGADLSVGAAQAAGSYTGTFDVTVNYQ